MSDYDQSAQPVRSNGVYETGVNDYPSSMALVGHAPNAAPSGTDAVKRLTVTDGEANSKALDVAMRHSNGDKITPAQPFPVYEVSAPGVELYDYKPDTLNAGASANHDVSPSGTFELREVAFASVLDGYFALQLKITATGAFAAKQVAFSTPSRPSDRMVFDPPIRLESGDTIRVVKTNRNAISPTDLHTTIKGGYIV